LEDEKLKQLEVSRKEGQEKMVDLGELALLADHLGLLAFMYVTLYSVFTLVKKSKSNAWPYSTIALLIIGLLGVLVDGYIVLKQWIR
jgi:hypothetical protein